MKWQPIETAPTADENVWVIVFGGRYDEPTTVPADGDWWRHEKLTATPTHWMPLPEPPKDQP